MALACAMLTTLVILGFWYGVEFAQALFLLAFPTIDRAALTVPAPARRIRRRGTPGEALIKAPDPAPLLDPGHRRPVDLRHRALGHVAEHARSARFGGLT